MYETHFDLDLFPFKVTPDPEFIFWDRQHRRAASILELGFAQLAPLSVLTGDVGAGKTTLLLHSLNKKPEGITTGLISNFSSGFGSIYEWILDAYGIAPEANEVDCLEAFQQFVLSEYAAGRRCVLVVDEAQNLSDSDLERLRMLTNINSGKDVLLMLFLVGQPQLRDHLKKPANRQIAQRIGPTFNLGPMTLADTQSYVRHRLSVAGGKGDIFDDDAIALIHRRTGGVPRLVNVVCEMAMVSAFGEGTKQIDGGFMQSFLDEADKSGLLAALPDPETGSAIPEPPATTPIEAMIFSDDSAFMEPGRGAPTPARTTSAQARQRTATEAQPDVVPFPKSNISVLREPQPPAPAEAKAADAVLPARPESADPTPPPGQLPSNLEEASPRIRRIPDRKLRRLAAAALVALAVLAVTSLPLDDRQPVDVASLDPPPEGSIDSTPVQSDLPAPPPQKPIEPFEDMSGAALLDSAIASGVTDPRAAAIAYARAALRGEDTAAYYLGQLYETGDGVTRDLAQARAWYGRAEESVRGARRRLADLGAREQTGEMTPPVPLLGGPITGGGAEFVWTSGDGADPAYFVVELSAGPQAPVTRLAPHEVTALAIDTIGEARIWRVLAVDAVQGRYAVSDWMPLGDLDNSASLGSGPVTADVIVSAPTDVDPEKLALVTGPLAAADIAYSTSRHAAGSDKDAGVHYYFKADAVEAEKIATLLGNQAEAVFDAPAASQGAQPLPGQVVVVPATR